ncbi:MAG: Bacterial antitoxin of type system, VapB [Candidatus Atribacteria bacterium]|nr:Bacterial antitoxin of type system, VapB [Candidatus Atribacteria bacterium]
MCTNIVIKDEPPEEVMKLAGIKTKKEVVNMALEEFVKTEKEIQFRFQHPQKPKK